MSPFTRFSFRAIQSLMAIILILQVYPYTIPVAYADSIRTTLDISKGNITIGNGTVTGKTPSGTSATNNANGYVITGTSTTYTVIINGGVEQNVTLENTSITKTTSAFVSIPTISIEGTGTKVNLTLSGTNTVSSYNGATQKAAISVPEGTELVIDTVDGTDNHSLDASSFSSAAAIGGNISETAGKITINHGTITAGFRNNGSLAAAIGGGKGGAGGTIVINGGVISAASYNGTGAAIGGGDVTASYPSKSTSVTINGGTITADVPSNAKTYFYDAIGYGYTSTANLTDNKSRTTVIVNGGNVFTKNSVPLLSGRQPVNSEGEILYSTAVKVNTTTVPAVGTAVKVKYVGKTLNTSILSNGSVFLFLPSGTLPIEITNLSTSKTYYGNVTTTTSVSSYPNSNATVSREFNTIPTVTVQGNADGRFYYGTPVTLAVTNLDEIVNKSGYPLVYGADFAVEWYKGAGGSPLLVLGDASNPAQLTVTATSGDVYRAKLVSISSEVSKLDANLSTNLSTASTADWLKRAITFSNLNDSYSFGQQGTVVATVSTGTDAIVFSSSDPSVISIDASTGEWWARKLGEATIKAAVAENSSAKQSAATVSRLVQVKPIQPLAPVHVHAVPGNEQADISFDVLANPDESINTAYTVTAWANGTDVKTAVGVSSPITVTGLTNGTAYTFTVTATNGAEVSLVSDPSEAVTPAAVPDKPNNVISARGDESATVSFTSPANNGSAITLYKVTAWANGTDVKSTVGESSPITVTGLTNGTAYTFTVTATNGVGESLASDPSEAVTPATVPSKPENVTAKAGNGSVEVSFAAPEDNGSVIVLYTAKAWSNGIAVKTATGESSPVTVTGLTNGTAYTFTVTATNEVGESLVSDPSEAVTPANVPSKPENATAKAGNGSVEVSFAAPEDNGSAIVLYTVKAWSNGIAAKTATGESSPVTVTGLTNGTAYTFTVTATNGVGESLVSDPSEAVTPATVPSKPENVTAKAGNGSVEVSFTAPEDNGSAIVLYTVKAWSNGITVKTATGESSPVTVTGLTNGTAYTFTVTATNEVGESLASEASNEVTPIVPEIPAQVPSKPENVTAKAGNGSVTVSFTAPEDNGSAIIFYTVTTWTYGVAVKSATYESSPATIAGLTNGITYTFTVTATNEVGESLASEASNEATPIVAETPAQVPSKPENVTAKAGNGSVEVSFTAPADNGSGIVLYTVTAWSSGVAVKTATGGSSPVTVTSLTNGNTYTFTVTATNGVGISENSERSSAVTLSSGSVTPSGQQTFGGGNNNAQNPKEVVIPAQQSGQVKYNDDLLVDIPRGAFDVQLLIKIEKVAETTSIVTDKDKLVSEVYEITKNVVGNFTKNVTLTFAIDTSILQDRDKSISVFYYDETNKRWIEIGGKIENGFITVEVNHFTKFAVFAVDKVVQTPPSKINLSDIAGHWAESWIKQAVTLQLLQGYADGTFNPNRTITRAEFVVILARALNLQTIGKELVFEDKDEIGSWASLAIARAEEVGLIQGYSDGTFRPNATITRAEIVTIIGRAYHFENSIASHTSVFADEDEIPAWSKSAVLVAYHKGIVSGREGNLFAPNQSATRAEAITVLIKALE